MEILTLAQRPDLHSAIWEMPSGWPPFMREDPVSSLMERLPVVFPELQFAALDADVVVGFVHAASFGWDGDRSSLPDRGWDAIILQAFRDHDRGNEPTAVTLLEAAVRPDRRGEGLSNALLVGVRDRCRELGYGALFGPVRPTQKSLEPTMPMTEYIARMRSDGLPEDPWLRAHARLGAQIVGIASASMTIGGSLAQWRGWTGLPFDRSGDVIVSGALVPVHASVEHDHAVYVEPNVWMMHEL